MSTTPYIEIIGLDDAIQAGVSQTYSVAGQNTIYTYHGPKDAVAALYDTLKLEIDSSTYSTTQLAYSYTDGDATLTVTYPTSDPASGWLTPADGILETFWEIGSNEIFRHIRSHDTFNKDTDQSVLDAVDEIIETKAWDRIPTEVAGEPQETYCKLLRRGTTEYRRSTPVIRKTTVISRKKKWSDLDDIWSSVDKAVTVSSIGLPSYMGTSFFTGWDLYDGTKKQWLTKAPSIRQQDKDKFEVIQEWEWCYRWSKTLYDGDIEADGSNP